MAGRAPPMGAYGPMSNHFFYQCANEADFRDLTAILELRQEDNKTFYAKHNKRAPDYSPYTIASELFRHWWQTQQLYIENKGVDRTRDFILSRMEELY